jgi:UDP-glucose 4-epimerase
MKNVHFAYRSDFMRFPATIHRSPIPASEWDAWIPLFDFRVAAGSACGRRRVTAEPLFASRFDAKGRRGRRPRFAFTHLVIMRVLVTGGAGYIGSVVVEELLAEGHVVFVLDNLSKGHRAAVAPGAEFIRADLRDRQRLQAVFERSAIDAVVHMAADSIVGESVKNPGKYYGNNMIAGLGLLDAMVQTGVQRLVFSSTAAVYGEPDAQPIDESAPTRPSNPYGETKLAFERALAWYESAHGLRHACLRYFNAAGASDHCGEDHDPETHLIPLVLHAALGRISHVTVFGEDYPTPDGTCIRDYVHVRDLARAHVLALGALARGSCIYNLGCGGGYSVREVIETAGRITGKSIPVQFGDRRAGDPARLVASSARIGRELDWQPQRGELGEILESAWRWMHAHPQGYCDD